MNFANQYIIGPLLIFYKHLFFICSKSCAKYPISILVLNYVLLLVYFLIYLILLKLFLVILFNYCLLFCLLLNHMLIILPYYLILIFAYNLKLKTL